MNWHLVTGIAGLVVISLLGVLTWRDMMRAAPAEPEGEEEVKGPLHWFEHFATGALLFSMFLAVLFLTFGHSSR